MHRPEFIQLIEDASCSLGITVTNFSENWAIKLRKNNLTQFIIGYTFPLNNSSAYKIARNKNLCSEILSSNDVPNVPHQLLLNPAILQKRNNIKGNTDIIQHFVAQHGFPFVIKKNNSSGGEGVYLIHDEPELEHTLSKVYATDSTLCLSPYRVNMREYRAVVLDNECLLSYEKQRPYITGNGNSSIIELLAGFQKKHSATNSKTEKIFDHSLMQQFHEVPKQNEKVFLKWKHNTSLGASYEIVKHENINDLSIKAAQVIGARFSSVDIVHSELFGWEVLEINASVVLNAFSSSTAENFKMSVDTYQQALKKVFVTNK